VHCLETKCRCSAHARRFSFASPVQFEHASHGVVSVAKLMSRIAVPSHLDGIDSKKAAASLHDHACGMQVKKLIPMALEQNHETAN